MIVLSFHFSSKLPSSTFPTIGAQIFGSPPIVSFLFHLRRLSLPLLPASFASASKRVIGHQNRRRTAENGLRKNGHSRDPRIFASRASGSQSGSLGFYCGACNRMLGCNAHWPGKPMWPDAGQDECSILLGEAVHYAKVIALPQTDSASATGAAAGLGAAALYSRCFS